MVHTIRGLPGSLCGLRWETASQDYRLESVAVANSVGGLPVCTFTAEYTPPAYNEAGNGSLRPSYEVTSKVTVAKAGGGTEDHTLSLTMRPENVIDARRFPLTRATVATVPTLSAANVVSGQLSYDVLVEERPIVRTLSSQLIATCGDRPEFALSVPPQDITTAVPSVAGANASLSLKYSGTIPTAVLPLDATAVSCSLRGTVRFQLTAPANSAALVVSRALAPHPVTFTRPAA